MGRDGSHGLLDRLKATTDNAHHRLEQDLDLLRQPLSRARFSAILQRFFGFHAVWEPAVSNLEAVAAFVGSRSKLTHLARDLEVLEPGSDLAALPRCSAADRLCASVAHAVGSMYVVEGSTLGGQFIGRVLQAAPWIPDGGLTYFNPYGYETGARWREFKVWAEATASDRPDEVERGALDTFELLHGWLTPGLPA